MTDFGKTCGSKKPISYDVQCKITCMLAQWTWLDMKPTSIVGDQELKELLYYLELSYALPSTTHVNSLVLKDHEDGQKPVCELLCHSTSIALTTDIWTSKATQAFMTTTAYFINEEWNFRSCVLGTVYFPGHHTGVQIADKVKETLWNFQIKTDQVSAVVHNQASNAVLAGRLTF